MKNGRAFQGKRKLSDNFENMVEINDLNVPVAPVCNVCVLGVYCLFFPKTIARKRVGFIQLGFGCIVVCKNYL